MANDEGVLLKVTQHFVQKGLILLSFWFARRQVQRFTRKETGMLRDTLNFVMGALSIASYTGC